MNREEKEKRRKDKENKKLTKAFWKDKKKTGDYLKAGLPFQAAQEDRTKRMDKKAKKANKKRK